MLWYGRSKAWNCKKFYKSRNYKCNLHAKRLAYPHPRKGSLYFPTLFVYIPSDWRVVIFKLKHLTQNTKVIFLYSDVYFFKLLLPTNPGSRVLFDEQTHTLTVANRFLSNWTGLYLDKVKLILHSFSKVFFKKLKFKGKGYYVYKSSRNTITTQFNHAHRIYIYAFFVSVKFLSKTSVLLFGTSKNDLLRVGYTLQKARPINIFTGRGVRFNRQIIYRKKGKISTYR